MPAFILVLGMTVYPVYFALRYSMFETRMWTTGDFVWLSNYQHLLGDPRFHTNMIASAFYVFVGVLVCTTIGLIIALKLRHGGKAVGILRAVILIPWITSEVVVAVTWRWMLNPQYGPVAYFTDSIAGLQFPNLFASTNSALLTLTLTNVWRSVAFPMLMLLAALQAVPREMEEAAAVDGATYMQKVRHILIPSIMPVMMVVVIVLTINYFNMVVLVIDLTGGGPMGSTEIIGLRLYREAFQFFNVDTAATLTMLMLIINIGLAVLYFRTLRRQSGGEA